MTNAFAKDLSKYIPRSGVQVSVHQVAWDKSCEHGQYGDWTTCWLKGTLTVLPMETHYVPTVNGTFEWVRSLC